MVTVGPKYLRNFSGNEFPELRFRVFQRGIFIRTILVMGVYGLSFIVQNILKLDREVGLRTNVGNMG